VSSQIPAPWLTQTLPLMTLWVIATRPDPFVLIPPPASPARLLPIVQHPKPLDPPPSRGGVPD
jgi:hypothetical protein